MKFVDARGIDLNNEDTPLWRYMSLDKFMDVLVNQRLFFANMDSFPDRSEGLLSEAAKRRMLEQIKEKNYSEHDQSIKLDIEVHRYNSMKGLTLVNCWSADKEENYALWKIYLEGGKAGVAIRTTLKQIKESIEGVHQDFPEDIHVSIVKYDHGDSVSSNRFDLVASKKSSYSYEKELRLIIFNYPRSEGGTKTPYKLSVGRYVNVDTSVLVDGLYLSPFAGNWFHSSFPLLLKQHFPLMFERIKQSSITES